MSHRETLNTVLADLAREAAWPADRHPSDNDLIAYEAGELAGEDHRRVQDHLVACEECARLVLELSALEPKALAGEETVSEFEIEQSLRKLRVRLRPPPPDHGDHTGWYKMLAAGLSVAVLGLASWVGILHSRGGGPKINDFVWSVSDTSTRGGADQPEVVELPAGSSAVTLLLSASKLAEQDAASYAEFRVEITGARTWSSDGLRPLGFNSFSVTLPRKDFPAGSYTVRILGSRDGQQELLAEYALELRHS